MSKRIAIKTTPKKCQNVKNTMQKNQWKVARTTAKCCQKYFEISNKVKIFRPIFQKLGNVVKYWIWSSLENLQKFSSLTQGA